ncbi:hypothetical protein [Nocardia sp. CY41]|uniref:hypothetical protein n=1 Tax=Nocardia sp. CY41 TaxID=2608686 RepID=UPI0013592D96|nr:hypothetical protein [Nocardia sp. CY41]
MGDSAGSARSVGYAGFAVAGKVAAGSAVTGPWGPAGEDEPALPSGQGSVVGSPIGAR